MTNSNVPTHEYFPKMHFRIGMTSTLLLFFVLVTTTFMGSLSIRTSKTVFNIINLDKDTVRWETVTKELMSKGVRPRQIQRIPGVYGKNLTKEFLRANVSSLGRAVCTRGMIGCYLSHRKFWEQTLLGKAAWQIVLEDDVKVSDDFCQKVEEMITELQENAETKDNWDVLLLGALGCVHPQGRHGWNRINAIVAGHTRQRRRVTKHCQIPYRPFGTHAYVLSKRGAEKLLRHASVATGHVDLVSWGILDLVLLCCDPMLAYQDMDSHSTIGAVTGGIESLLPKLIVDRYTGITVQWCLNEPLLRIPRLGVVVTIGRAILWALTGIVVGVMVFKEHRWLLQLHAIAIIGFAWFLRFMNSPVSMFRKEC